LRGFSRHPHHARGLRSRSRAAHLAFPLSRAGHQRDHDLPRRSDQTLEDTVTQIIEQKLNGIDNLRYIEAAATSTGTLTADGHFEGGTDPDIAQWQVPNKVALATPLLPRTCSSRASR